MIPKESIWTAQFQGRDEMRQLKHPQKTIAIYEYMADLVDDISENLGTSRVEIATLAIKDTLGRMTGEQEQKEWYLRMLSQEI